MSSFLGELAESLYRRYGDKIGELSMLFPSRRARLFFVDELSKIADRPLWQPRWVSIDDLMGSIAGLKVGGQIRLISELYSVYLKYHPNEEFDKFYYWGEIMLGDFDMVDKYLIDATQLFRNISDIKELESDVSYLNDRQKSIVAFWSSIGSGEELSDSKRHFLKIWRSLLPIYREYRERLIELGIAYPGLIYRLAVERLKGGADSELITPDSRFVVAGFNALSESEKELFRALKGRVPTEFHWDRDDYYIVDRGQEAGLFLRDNIVNFPAADSAVTHNNFYNGKSVEVVACSSSALQCKYVAKILQDIAKESPIDRRTAIVLTDEGLLLPLLYALDPSVGGVNVTMGYPIRQTLAYSFVERLLELQQRSRRDNFYHLDVDGLLSHPYINSIVEQQGVQIQRRIEREKAVRVPTSMFEGSELSDIFRVCNSDWRELSGYLSSILEWLAGRSEELDERINFIPYLSHEITTLNNSIEECGIDLPLAIYISLLRRHLQRARVPFEGEPLEGLQVMGILESRNLDFDNVIILSMNDDNFPSNRTTQPSYVPYTLRSAYGMPTPSHHDGVYAYYFYRLIQRSKSLKMLYCSRADERSTGEQSRYITQLEYESKLDIKRINVGVDVGMVSRGAVEVRKEGRVAEDLNRYMIPLAEQCDEQTKRYKGYKQLSPTQLSTYISCPLKFYYKHIAEIYKERELEERVDAPSFGNILHGAMESLYTPYINASKIPPISDEKIRSAIDQQIVEIYGDTSMSDFSGNLSLVRNVVFRYIKDGVIRYDSDQQNSDFVVESVEGLVVYDIEQPNNLKISIRGLCDRIDRVERGWRIVDYKTGRPHQKFAGVDSLFEGKARSECANIFQILLYCYIVSHRGLTSEATPALYYVVSMNDPKFSPAIENTAQEQNQMSIFGERLNILLTELFDPNVPFTQCDETERTCQYCDYRTLCQR